MVCYLRPCGWEETPVRLDQTDFPCHRYGAMASLRRIGREVAPRPPPQRDASSESVGNYHPKTHEEDTAVRAVSPPSMYLRRSFLRTSLDASEEVSCFPPRRCLDEGRKFRGKRGMTSARGKLRRIKNAR